MDKILSISVAAYNVEKYLKKTISSITNSDQDILNLIEIIIINDGSTDNTSCIAENFASLFPNTVKVINKKNGGYGSTINAGILVASGKYFKQLDGDDWFLTENLRSFVLYLRECNSDLVLTPYYNFFENNNSIHQIDNHDILIKQSIDLYRVAFTNNIQMHELTIQTDLLRKNCITISENTFYTDNEYTFLPLIYAETISKFDLPIYVYRLGRAGQSVSLSGAMKHYKDTITVAKKMIQLFDMNRFEEIQSIMSIKYKNIIDAVYMYHLCSDKSTAKIELMEFDLWLKNTNLFLYKLSNEIKKIKLLRMSAFILFKVLSVKYINAWNKNK